MNCITFHRIIHEFFECLELSWVISFYKSRIRDIIKNKYGISPHFFLFAVKVGPNPLRNAYVIAFLSHPLIPCPTLLTNFNLQILSSHHHATPPQNYGWMCVATKIQAKSSSRPNSVVPCFHFRKRATSNSNKQTDYFTHSCVHPQIFSLWVCKSSMKQSWVGRIWEKKFERT